MSEPAEQRSHRLHLARPLLVLVFLLQRLGDGAVFYTSYLPANPEPVLRAVAFASLLWTSALLVGVWRRLRWARYVLTSFCWLYAFGIAFLSLERWRDFSAKSWDARFLLLVAAVAYFASNIILVRSRRVRHFANH